MKAIFYLLLVGFVMYACDASDVVRAPEPNTPELEDSLWVDLLSDLYLAEALKNKRAVSNYNISDEIRYLDSSIVSEYNLTPAEFEKAYLNLGKDMSRIAEIYNQVLEKLSKLEERLKTDTLKTYRFPEDLR